MQSDLELIEDQGFGIFQKKKADKESPVFTGTPEFPATSNVEFDNVTLETILASISASVTGTKGMYNITLEVPLTPGTYYTSTTARAAVPTGVRIVGLVLTYATAANTWYAERYKGTSATSGWTTYTNWERVIIPNTLLLNQGDHYPLDGSFGTFPTDDNLWKAKEWLVDAKIYNANPASYYRLVYVGKDNATYADVIAIEEWDKVADTKIRDIIPLGASSTFEVAYNATGITVIELSEDTLESTYPDTTFPNGLKFILTTQYAKISTNNKIDLNGGGAKVRFHEACIQSYYRTPYQTFDKQLMAKNLVYKNGDTLEIRSKWDASEDLSITFGYTMFNQLMTFSSVQKYANTGKRISTAAKTSTVTLNTTATTDNIGLYVYTGRSDFAGGNHGLEGVLDNLASNYTAGQTTMVVTDGTKFVATGGWARAGATAPNPYQKFSYTSVTINTLNGIVWEGTAQSLTTSHQVQVYARTAETMTYKFYADGKELPEREWIAADEVEVVVKNKIYHSPTLNYTDGTMDIAMYEEVYYRVSDGNIEVMLQNNFQKEVDITLYYGMQLLSASWQNKVYLAHAADTAIVLKSTNPNSGAHGTYPCEKIIVSNADFSINCAMYFDPNSSYYVNKATYLDAADFLFEANSNGKIYHYTVAKAVTIALGTKEWWRGVYSFFKNPTLTGASYAYKMKLKGVDHVAFDFHSAASEVISVPNLHSITATQIQKDGTVTVNTEVKPLGFEVSASAYGTGLFKLLKG